MISIFAPDGIGEVAPGTDLPGVLVAAVRHDPAGPLADGDILVVTSKIISKVEGRIAPEDARQDVISAEAVRTVASRGTTRIVRTRTGLVLAAAGVDRSNVAAGAILLLPEDPDRSATRLRAELQRLTGKRLGVVISDTAGRPWREGQTDQAIGAAGVRVIRRYAGELDAYGNRLEVTATGLADELAAAADLVKGKLGGRPLAVIRGLGDLVDDSAGAAAELVRPGETDMFGFGSREAVLAAVLAVTGHQAAYERLVRLDGTERSAAVLDLVGADGEVAELLRALLDVDLTETAGAQPPEIDSPRLSAPQPEEFSGGRQDQPVRAQR
ncbi:MAG TPA: coenzyme F420-0:L-glutamate ligase [Propionibacteriaceae bacterium]|nr:coenzyme F420-0:L-glutamate ligase [Propionibacteriaceae bacterium]